MSFNQNLLIFSPTFYLNEKNEHEQIIYNHNLHLDKNSKFIENQDLQIVGLLQGLNQLVGSSNLSVVNFSELDSIDLYYYEKADLYFCLKSGGRRRDKTPSGGGDNINSNLMRYPASTAEKYFKIFMLLYLSEVTVLEELTLEKREQGKHFEKSEKFQKARTNLIKATLQFSTFLYQKENTYSLEHSKKISGIQILSSKFFHTHPNYLIDVNLLLFESIFAVFWKDFLVLSNFSSMELELFSEIHVCLPNLIEGFRYSFREEGEFIVYRIDSEICVYLFRRSVTDKKISSSSSKYMYPPKSNFTILKKLPNLIHLNVNQNSSENSEDNSATADYSYVIQDFNALNKFEKIKNQPVRDNYDELIKQAENNNFNLTDDQDEKFTSASSKTSTTSSKLNKSKNKKKTQVTSITRQILPQSTVKSSSYQYTIGNLDHKKLSSISKITDSLSLADAVKDVKNLESKVLNGNI